MQTTTPKPWRTVPTTVKGAGTARRDIVSDGAKYRPAYVAGDIAPADAELMAAAPDLLDALQALTDWGRTYTSPTDPNSPHQLLIAAVAALQKAGAHQ